MLNSRNEDKGCSLLGRLRIIIKEVYLGPGLQPLFKNTAS